MEEIVAFFMGLDLASLGIGGLAGAFLSGLFNHWLAKSRGKKDRMASASRELRAAFTDELSKLANAPDNAFDILRDAYPKHEKAVSEFTHFLSSSAKRRFLEAWDTYRCHPKNPGVPFLEQYSKHLGDVNLAARNRALAIERINRVLAFAEHT